MTAHVEVIRWGERPGQSHLHALIVTVAGLDAGLALRTPGGWTAVRRPAFRLPFRPRHVLTEHPTAAAAVAAILAGRTARWLGATPYSPVRWSDAAARAARDTWASA